MKNLHKLALGLVVGAMAIMFSAFKGNETPKVVSTTPYASIDYYYNITGVPSTNPADFVYRDASTPAACSAVAGVECNAQWRTANAPVNGQNPQQAHGSVGVPTYIGNTTQGRYNKL